VTTLATLFQSRLLVDRYQISEVLGFGGMRAVFRAHHERLLRDVAVKVLTAAPSPCATA
jgi:serine/threonine protein kinase